MGIFQSSPTRYEPLSEAGFISSSRDSGSISRRHWDNTRNVCRGGCPPVCSSWQYPVLSCMFVIGLLVGGAFGLLGSTYKKHATVEEMTLTGADLKQFAPKMPTTTVVFSKQPALMGAPNDANQRFWDALMPTGHGFVNVSDPESYGLLPGITSSSGVDRYSVAMFHQLHCLGLLHRNYWRLIDGMSEAWTDGARQEEVRKQLRDRHSQHCFAYIAESIMCSGDLTIEWAKVERDGSRTQVDGWGVPHQCKDPSAIRAWMEANHGPVKDSSIHLRD